MNVELKQILINIEKNNDLRSLNRRAECLMCSYSNFKDKDLS